MLIFDPCYASASAKSCDCAGGLACRRSVLVLPRLVLVSLIPCVLPLHRCPRASRDSPSAADVASLPGCQIRKRATDEPSEALHSLNVAVKARQGLPGSRRCPMQPHSQGNENARLSPASFFPTVSSALTEARLRFLRAGGV